MPVSIVKTPPRTWISYYVGAAVLVAAVIALVVLLMQEDGNFVIPAFVLLVFGPAYGWSLWRAARGAGKPLCTVDDAGITTGSFAYPWNRVIAVGYRDGNMKYLKKRPAKAKAIQNKGVRSLIVTTTDLDGAGRPRQYGYTLVDKTENNHDEFLRAVRRYAPGVRLGTEVLASDYAVDQARVAELADRLDRNGRLEIVTSRRKPVAVLTPDEFVHGKLALKWSELSAVTAYTHLDTTATSIGTFTARDPRLAFWRQHDRRECLVLDYAASYSPTLEELGVLIDRIAPHVVVADRRSAS